MADRVCIFWDNSNIFIPARYLANRREGWSAERDVRIHFDNMFSLARAGREIEAAVCVGSVPPELEAVWDRLERAGVEVELFERGAGSGCEQGIDQCLQVHMLRALADIHPPAVAVLLTGDGEGYETGVGFHADLERLARAGWGVEVVSWNPACNKRLRAWAEKIGVYVPLDDYYLSVTFLEGARRAQALNLTHRGVAVPKVVGAVSV
jgi:hypothetical protein